MIKVGIIGADKPDAGELLRLLIFHPEVEVMSLYAPGLAGRAITSSHHGFIGERDLFFSDSIDSSKLDVVFIADSSQMASTIKDDARKNGELRIVDLSPDRFENWENTEMEYGLSEINRKPLVRGAKMAIVPTSVASLALIALIPLASNLLLPKEIFLTVLAPEEMKDEIDENKVREEITRQLKNVQNSFSGDIHIKVVLKNSGRTMRVIANMACPLGIAEIDRIYNSVYDDHNFAYTSLSKIGGEEVEGTQKCIISISKPGAGLLEVESLGDCRMRGGAGDAVHAMNLLFALHEKVGLSLKPSCYGEHPDKTSRQMSWFA